MPFIVDLPPPNKQLDRTSIQIIKDDAASGKVSDINTLKLDQDLMDRVYLNSKFESLVKAWKKNTIFESSISNIIEDQNFKDIVAMKDKAIPLIIEEIDREPSILVWALNMITKRSVDSRQRLTITEACKKWVKAYKRGPLSLT